MYQMQWLKKVVRLLCPVVHQESRVSNAVAKKSFEKLCPIVHQEIHETFRQKGGGIHETEITSRTLQSGIPANSIRVRNYTSPPDLISYSTQDPQFLTNSYKPEGEKMR